MTIQPHAHAVAVPFNLATSRQGELAACACVSFPFQDGIPFGGAYSINQRQLIVHRFIKTKVVVTFPTVFSSTSLQHFSPLGRPSLFWSLFLCESSRIAVVISSQVVRPSKLPLANTTRLRLPQPVTEAFDQASIQSQYNQPTHPNRTEPQPPAIPNQHTTRRPYGTLHQL